MDLLHCSARYVPLDLASMQCKMLGVGSLHSIIYLRNPLKFLFVVDHDRLRMNLETKLSIA